MKAKDLHGKSKEQLQEQLVNLLKQQFTLRMQKATGQLGQTHLIKQTRRDVARIKTAINQVAK